MSDANASERPLRFGLVVPEKVVAILSAEQMSGEQMMTVRLALVRRRLSLSPSDGRRTGNCQVGVVCSGDTVCWLQSYKGSSGCAIHLDKQLHITYTEPGLESLVGRTVQRCAVLNWPDWCLYFVFDGQPIQLSERTIDETVQFTDTLYAMLDG